MAKGQFDQVYEEMGSLFKLAQEEMDKMVGDEPLGARKVPGKEMFDIASSLSPQDIDTLVMEFGESAVNGFLFDAYKAGTRGGNNA